jgi:hypothetical protein
MPWKECHVEDERLRFVARLLDGEKMARLCVEFGSSRKTGYKIFDRYKDVGLQGLTDRSGPTAILGPAMTRLSVLVRSVRSIVPHACVVAALAVLPGCFVASEGPLLDERLAVQPFPDQFSFASDPAGSVQVKGRARRVGKLYEGLNDEGRVISTWLTVWLADVLVLQICAPNKTECVYAFLQPDRDRWRAYPFARSEFSALLKAGNRDARFLESNKFVELAGDRVKIRSVEVL